MNDRINWYRTPVDKVVLKELNKRSDLHGFLQAGSILLLCILTGYHCYIAYKSGVWWWILVAFFLHGTVMSFNGPAAATHELSHGTPFKTKFWNEFFIRIFSFLNWTNYVLFRASHNRHHQLTLHTGRDLEVIMPARFRLIEVLYVLTIDPKSIYDRLKTQIQLCFGKIEGEWPLRLFPPADAKGRKELFGWARVLVVGHLALAGFFIAIGQWVLIPIILLPMYSPWLALLCGAPQHAGLQTDRDDFRYLCRTMLISFIPRRLYWNMSYHIEHHMYAAVPFWQLPKLHDLIKHDSPVPNKGLLSTWKEILEIQQRQKTEPGYTFDQFERMDNKS